jgi:hypothetical protein
MLWTVVVATLLVLCAPRASELLNGPEDHRCDGRMAVGHMKGQ